MTEDELREIESRWDDDRVLDTCIEFGKDPTCGALISTLTEACNAARSNVPALLAEVRRLRAELAAANKRARRTVDALLEIRDLVARHALMPTGQVTIRRLGLIAQAALNAIAEERWKTNRTTTSSRC